MAKARAKRGTLALQQMQSKWQRHGTAQWWSGDKHFVIEKGPLGYRVIATNGYPESPSNWSGRGTRQPTLRAAKAAVTALRKEVGPWSPSPWNIAASATKKKMLRPLIHDGDLFRDTKGVFYQVKGKWSDKGYDAMALSRGRGIEPGTRHNIPWERIKQHEGWLVYIAYFAIKNGREDHGWLPQIVSNGTPSLSTWAPNGFDKEDAVALAKRYAKQEAERYGGDQHVTIELRKPTADEAAGRRRY